MTVSKDYSAGSHAGVHCPFSASTLFSGLSWDVLANVCKHISARSCVGMCCLLSLRLLSARICFSHESWFISIYPLVFRSCVCQHLCASCCESACLSPLVAIWTAHAFVCLFFSSLKAPWHVYCTVLYCTKKFVSPSWRSSLGPSLCCILFQKSSWQGSKGLKHRGWPRIIILSFKFVLDRESFLDASTHLYEKVCPSVRP